MLSTQVVASLMKDVISAVYFLHNMNPPIIHRDIKPENVLLAEGNIAKLTDFGWSNYIQGEEKRTTVCGTPIYLAPEIINESGHDEKVDIWCIGVLLFELSTGTVPFAGNDIDTLKRNINAVKINWPRDINLEAKNLISKILKYVPSSRISLREMLMHPYFTKYFPNAVDCLVKPNDNLTYVPFVVSKDNPLTYNPICDDKNNNNSNNNNSNNDNKSKNERNRKKSSENIISARTHNREVGKSREKEDRERNNNKFRDVSPVPNTKLRLETDGNIKKDNSYMKLKYNILLKNYEKLENDFEVLKNKSEDPNQKEVERLIKELNEKDIKFKHICFIAFSFF